MTEGLLTKVTAGLKQFVASNPSVLTAKSLINQKGGYIASKTQQSDSLWLAVNPPPFDKGGKCGGAKQGIVRFWKGWWSDNPSGSRPNFFGRQHLTFDKGGKCDGAKQGIVRVWEIMRGEGGGEAIPPS